MPFTVDEFFAVFAAWNAAIWPLQPVTLLAGVVLAVAALRTGGVGGGPVYALLAAMWAINGIGYHGLYFSRINPLAPAFAAAFVAEAALLAAAAWRDRRARFAAGRGWRQLAGAALIAFALAAYPLWGHLAGHRYPAVPVFGVAPCPTTIFTIGMLLLGQGRWVTAALAIPALWSAVGGSAAVLLGVPQDYGLIAALILLVATTARSLTRRGPPPAA